MRTTGKSTTERGMFRKGKKKNHFLLGPKRCQQIPLFKDRGRTPEGEYSQGEAGAC